MVVERKEIMKKRNLFLSFAIVSTLCLTSAVPTFAAETAGNTYQWDYQVSAVYSGKNAVSSIRTTWRGSASLRNSASISLGVSNSGVSAGASSSWQNINTVTKYWENTNGAKESSCRSNMVVTPRKDYRSGTVSIINTARVKLSKDAKPYEISASC